MEQLAVAACVRLQPQIMEDELRAMTQTCTAKSHERSLRNSLAGVVKVGKFSSQIPLLQTTGRDELQCRGTIYNVFKVQTKPFLKSTSYFLRNSLKSSCTTQLLTFVYLRQLTLSQKALRHALHHPLYSTLGIETLHIHTL